MKNKIAIIASLVSVLSFAGCKDFLETKPMDFVSPNNFTTENDIVLALNGAYDAFTIDKRSPISIDFTTDNGLVTLSGDGEINFWDQTQTQVSPPTVRKWEQDYRGILRANTVLKYAPKISISDEKRNRYIGEALFIKAYFYADLIDFYGDVPYRNEPEGLEKKDSPRVDKSTIVKNLLEDLTKAASFLPVSYSSADVGRATKGAALTLKAKILLYNQRWEEAAATCAEVMGLNYGIYNDFYAMFSGEAAENNKEVIFDIQYIQNQASKGMSHQFKTLFNSYSSYMALQNLEKEYYMTNGKSISNPTSGYNAAKPWINRDPRLSYTFTLPYATDGFTNAGDVKYYYPTQKKSANFSSLRIRKWVDYSDGGVNSISGNNIILLRYADVLLMRAEALLNLDNWNTYKLEIISLVNQVRKRPGVGMPTIENSEGIGVGREALKDIVRHERRVEFAFEGTRSSDIRRWAIGADAYIDGIGYRPELLGIKESTAKYQLYTIRKRSFSTEKGYLWPIPLEEMQSNLAIKQNNPGY